MTQSARDLAAHLESKPEVPFRYADCPAVGIHDKLSLDDKAAYLRPPLPENSRTAKGSAFWKFSTIAEHWEKALRRVPTKLPILQQRDRVDVVKSPVLHAPACAAYKKVDRILCPSRSRD